ncbi:MAG: hypothetical protein ABIN67_20870 [Ferruginibacter sp.]
MNNRIILMLATAIVLFQLYGCGPAIKKFVNSKYPPVSSLEKSAGSLKNSIAELEKIPKIDLGARLDESFLDSTIHLYFEDLYKSDPTLGAPSVEKIEIIQNPKFSISKQEIIASAEFKFFLRDNKYVKSLSINFSGRLSPSVNEDSLKLAPSFDRIHITQLKLRRCLFLGSIAKAAVNTLCQNFRDNINGQIKQFVIKINYPPFPELPLSSLLGSDENISVTNDYTFKMKRQTLHPVILLKPGSIAVIAGIDESRQPVIATATTSRLSSSLPLPPQPNYILNIGVDAKIINEAAQIVKDKKVVDKGDLISINNIQSRLIEEETFNTLFEHFDSSFTSAWNSNLDIMPANDSSNNSVRLSYDVMSRITNELFKDARFGIKYSLDTKSDFPEKEISLGEIGKPDCSSITFDCQFNNCSNVLSDCGSCGFFDALCHVRWAACQVSNGVKYGACQASNVAKATWCAGELVARKALCYTEIAAIFIYDNLIKDIGKFGGYAEAKGIIAADITQTIPNGINSITLNGNLNANINANVNLKFAPAGLIGHLICTFPLNENFSTQLQVDQPISLTANIERQNIADACLLNLNFNKITIPIQLSEPLLVEILKKPLLVLNCGFSIGLGISITTVLALAGNENFKNYLRAALFASYKLDIEKSFGVKIPAIPLNVIRTPILLYPTWGSKSIVFTKK